MLLAAWSAAAQRPGFTPPPLPQGTSAIRGRVVDSNTKAPVAGCELRIMASGQVATLVTDLAGSYELKDVAAGEYYFNFQCPAHLMNCLPDIAAPTRAEADAALRRTCLIDVARDQQRDGVDFLVTPGAIARGQVMTAEGRPVTRASVRLGRGIKGEPTARSTPSITDTEGRFELTNLPAGEWRVEVEIPQEPGGLRPPIVYYPGGLSWEDATGVALEAGKIKDRLTITVPRINENVLTVSLPPPDATMSAVAVSVLRESPLIVRRIDINAEGVGTLKGIVPGRYFVSARAESQDKQWAAFEVVDFIEDNYEARLQLLPTGSIIGKIIGDKGNLPSLAGLMVGASWTHDGAEINPLDVDEVPAAADGSFRIDNLFGTRKLQLRALDVDWEVAAVRLGRSDVTSFGITVAPDAAIEATIVIRRR